MMRRRVGRFFLVLIAVYLGAGPALHPLLEPARATPAKATAESADSRAAAAPSLVPPCENPSHHHGKKISDGCAICAWSNSVHLATPQPTSFDLSPTRLGVARTTSRPGVAHLPVLSVSPRAPPAWI